ncbi:MAG: S8 family serine peptidase [Chitinophagaceae bacterium]
MIKKILFLLLVFFPGLCSPGSAQTLYTRYKILFTDKNGTPFTLQDPTPYLSPRAIQRRIREHIVLDSTDLPVVPRYLDSLRDAGAVKILYVSKWLNLAVIQTSDQQALAKIAAFPFVKKSDSVALRMALSPFREDTLKFGGEDSLNPNPGGWLRTGSNPYGNSYAQIHLHQGDYLQQLGYRGQGMVVAMLDAGFQQVDVNRAFDSLRNDHRILGTWNFVYDTSYVYGYHFHGANCLSIMAANLPEEMVGSAPKASYLLLITEDVRSEQPIEEDNWVAGAEFADSAGADVISSSLGYNLFDNPVFNHSYADMNGKTTDITRGADLAVQKGMIVVNAAGNEGTSPWRYIIAPADGIGVLAIGAVNTNGQVAPFSSYGPSSDGRIKPDLASVGWNTSLVDITGQVTTGNGTSYACPNLAGLIACLWQAFPEMDNLQIIRAVEESADHYQNPDDRVGYGLPNFRVAYDSLKNIENALGAIQSSALLQGAQARVFPNPFHSLIHVIFHAKQDGKMNLRLLDAMGKTEVSQQIPVQGGEYHLVDWGNLSNLSQGIYFLQLVNGSFHQTFTLIKF